MAAIHSADFEPFLSERSIIDFQTAAARAAALLHRPRLTESQVAHVQKVYDFVQEHYKDPGLAGILRYALREAMPYTQKAKSINEMKAEFLERLKGILVPDTELTAREMVYFRVILHGIAEWTPSRRQA